jgi:hypothetical protein
MTSVRTKATAASHEAVDISALITGIRDRNACGLRVISAFAERFPTCSILDARPRSGSPRETHYDFEVLVHLETGAEEWKRVEHKGSTKYTPIKPTDTPWQAGVQFHNGGCEKYSLAKQYARVWYDHHIASGSLTSGFGIVATAPTFDEWFARDCKAQADPGTAFGKELKTKVRAARGAKASLLAERAPVLAALAIGEAELETLKAEVLPIANEVLLQKDYWLAIHGSVTGDFHAAWYPPFTIGAIREVRIEKRKDIHLQFECEGGFTFRGILRWGKGAGFSCLRLDLK